MLDPFLTRLRGDQSGATAIEYALMATLVALVIIGGLTGIGSGLSAFFTSVAGNL